jgi:DNA-binding NtrC family response regulator
VRELRNVIEQAVLLAPADRIDTEQLNLSSVLGSAPGTAPATPETQQEGSRLDRAERELLLKALDTAEWNVTRAAKHLGVSRDTLRYRMEKFQLTPRS